MFIVPLFIDKGWYIHPIKYYSAVKRYELLNDETTWINLNNSRLRDKRQTVHTMVPFIWTSTIGKTDPWLFIDLWCQNSDCSGWPSKIWVQWALGNSLERQKCFYLDIGVGGKGIYIWITFQSYAFHCVCVYIYVHTHTHTHTHTHIYIYIYILINKKVLQPNTGRKEDAQEEERGVPLDSEIYKYSSSPKSATFTVVWH